MIIITTIITLIIIVSITTTVIIIMVTQEYSEVDIHRAIGICAINSVTLEPRRLFQGPPKGQLKFLRNLKQTFLSLKSKKVQLGVS